MSVLQQFKERMHKLAQTDEERAWMDDRCLERFLKARDYDLQKAEKMLTASLEWRFRTYKPHEIQRSEVQDVLALGTLYRNGKDRQGRPIMHIKPGGYNPYSVELRVRAMMYVLEEAIASMDENVEQMVWMLDFTDYGSRSRSPDGRKVAMSCLHLLQDNYPERLGLAFVVNPPWFFSLLFAIISPFMSSSTKAKIRLIHGTPEKLREILTPYIDDENLEKCYGGTREEGYLVEPDVLELRRKAAAQAATPARKKRTKSKKQKQKSDVDKEKSAQDKATKSKEKEKVSSKEKDNAKEKVGTKEKHSTEEKDSTNEKEDKSKKDENGDKEEAEDSTSSSDSTESDDEKSN